MAEAERMKGDLRRAGIQPGAWVINQSLLGAGSNDLLLAHRAAAELPYIQRVREQSPRTALVPWLPVEPVGPGSLSRLVRA